MAENDGHAWTLPLLDVWEQRTSDTQRAAHRQASMAALALAVPTASLRMAADGRATRLLATVTTMSSIAV